MPSFPRLIVLLPLVAVVACGTGQSPSAEGNGPQLDPPVPDAVSAREAIEAANARFVRALLAGDAVGVGANYAADAVVMMPDQPAWIGRTAIDSATRALLAAATFRAVTFATDEVLIGGDLAVERGSGAWTWVPKGRPALTERVKYLTVWRRQADGSLKIIRDINNRDAAEAEVTPPRDR